MLDNYYDVLDTGAPFELIEDEMSESNQDWVNQPVEPAEQRWQATSTVEIEVAEVAETAHIGDFNDTDNSEQSPNLDGQILMQQPTNAIFNSTLLPANQLSTNQSSVQSSAPFGLEEVKEYVETIQGNLGNLNIALIGVGEGGCKSVDYLVQQGLKNVSYAMIDSNDNSFRNRRQEVNYILMAKSDIINDPENCMNHHIDSIKSVMESASMVFIVSALGRVTGSSLTPVVAKIANEMGKLSIGFFNMPKSKKKPEDERANQVVAHIQKDALLNGLLLVPNDRFRELCPNERVSDAYKMSYQLLTDMVVGMNTLVDYQAETSIDFEDIQNCLLHKGLIFFGHVKGQGNDLESLQQAFDSMSQIALTDKVDYKNAASMLLNLRLPDSLTFAEEDWIDEEILSHAANVSKWNFTIDETLPEGTFELTFMAMGITQSSDVLNIDNALEDKLNEASQKHVESYTESNVQPDVERNIQPSIQPNVQPNVQPDVQPDAQSHVELQAVPLAQLLVEPQTQSHIPPHIESVEWKGTSSTPEEEFDKMNDEDKYSPQIASNNDFFESANSLENNFPMDITNPNMWENKDIPESFNSENYYQPVTPSSSLSSNPSSNPLGNSSSGMSEVGYDVPFTSSEVRDSEPVKSSNDFVNDIKLNEVKDEAEPVNVPEPVSHQQPLKPPMQEVQPKIVQEKSKSIATESTKKTTKEKSKIQKHSRQRDMFVNNKPSTNYQSSPYNGESIPKPTNVISMKNRSNSGISTAADVPDMEDFFKKQKD